MQFRAMLWQVWLFTGFLALVRYKFHAITSLYLYELHVCIYMWLNVTLKLLLQPDLVGLVAVAVPRNSLTAEPPV